MDRQTQDQVIKMQNELALKDRAIARLSTEKEALMNDLQNLVNQFNELNHKYTALVKVEEGEAGEEEELIVS